MVSGKVLIFKTAPSDTTTGTGIRVDGDKAVKTKSMNVDAFTQYNQGGVGVAVTNEGYAQLVSVFTICCDKAITVHAGGQADVANSNCSFGTLGLVADGKGNLQYVELALLPLLLLKIQSL